MNTPTREQIAAADPAHSAWVMANAGSGKTRVLTQRVARLLLAGSAPDRILCLTYTKAAASEMQSRLFAMLGRWALAGDADLGAELAALEGATEPVADPDRLARARRLFARALETPGGLRIQTIHAFCDALLRRFPLEAGVSPRFEVMDDHARAAMLARLRADLAAEAESGGDPAFDAIAGRLNEEDVDALVSAILARRGAFAAGEAEERLTRLFGDAASGDPAVPARAALSTLDRDRIARFAEVMQGVGGKGGATAAAGMLRALDLIDAGPAAAASALCAAFLTAEGAPRSRKGFPTKAVLSADPGADALTDTLIDWAVSTRARLNAASVAARARDLDRFARALLGRYAAAKAARGLLDFDDLVDRAVELLTRSDMRGWVLFKLDAGIAHILVDEAQDTAPEQWRIVDAIAEEFAAGEGAAGQGRTLFVVGDEKQSIYSFQGAEPEAFGRMRARFECGLAAAGQRLVQPSLFTSFRSAPAILSFVDAVFAGTEHGLTQEPGEIRHEAHRAGDPARVDLWPLVEPLEKPVQPPWDSPVDAPSTETPKLRLAERLAGEIARMVREDTLPLRGTEAPRPVTPGDILVLVRSRDMLASSLIRELKSRGVPVAGADRLILGDELAVKDLLAAIATSLTPSDDLSLAALLRSPLCDVSEEALFDLAHDRPGPLRSAVLAAADRHPREAAMLRDLADRADYLRPYEFLERILIRHDGQRRLIARLGPEAADAIDELLAQALAYEAAEPPTLTGFLAWIGQGDIQLKREMDRGHDAVRVMTVHGAKGLEAPVVILPDTMKTLRAGRGPTLLPSVEDEDLTLWLGGRGGDDAVASGARAASEARAAAEMRRLLYVALTRAEDWLILCGAGDAEQIDKDERWYGRLKAAMEQCGAEDVDGPDATRMHRLGPPVVPRPKLPEVAASRSREQPPWISVAPREARPSRPAPSSLLPEAEDGGGAGRGRDVALAHGRAVHLVLERLADHPPEDRAVLAERLLTADAPDMDAAGRAAAVAEAEAVLAAPFAVSLFGPDSLAEAGLALDLPEIAGTRMLGRIDRLVVRPEAVQVVDFKTDAVPPVRPEDVPAVYRAQLGAYVQALGRVFHGRPVSAALLWTAGPDLMEVPAPLLDAALARVSGGSVTPGVVDSTPRPA